MKARITGSGFVAVIWLTSCVHPQVARLQAAMHVTAPVPSEPAVPPYPSDDAVAAGIAAAAGHAVSDSYPYRWRAQRPQTEPLAAGGALRVRERVTDGSSSASLDVIAFDERRCAVRVIDQPDASAGGGVIANAMRECGAVGGVNGGYFTPEFQPLGLMIASGRPAGTFATSALLGGLLTCTDGRPRLLWRNEYSPAAGSTDLVQAGPRLVDAGRALAKLDGVKSRPRTFVATDGHGGWALGIVNSLTLGDLAELLASPDIIPGFRIARALNLDGGRSSAIWMRTAGGTEISEPGWSTVRNFIAVIPR